ncbi:hypothetical protein PHMEG_0002630 [Phytophthora megakarya]|uniref:Spindle pole body component n=1 Tax=Phytophthora megakarya TaxID=4795 RepID=A0A225X0D1_9STRA|nr:hypothetical protein PHMEG_0002630 [Phytophthora megakarya]
MAPVPAWTREWRPLAKQLCARMSDRNDSHNEEQSSVSNEKLLLRADRVVGQLYAHRFADSLPQDVQVQTQALATKFRVHSLEDRAEKLLQLAPHCDYQVLKLLLELATSPTTATDEDVAVDMDATSRWQTVLQQEQLKQQQRKQMQDQIVDELFQISTNDEWYQAWDDSDEESDWDVSSVDENTKESERSVDARQRNPKRPSEVLQDEDQEVIRRTDLSDEALMQDEVLCRYYPEVIVQDMETEDTDDPTCALEKKTIAPFTLDRPWLLCETVVNGSKPSDVGPCRLIHEETVVGMIFEALDGVDSLLFEFRPVKPSPPIFSLDFQTKVVEQSRQSRNVAIGHLSPLALQHFLGYFVQAASELQVLRDFLQFIRQSRDLSEQHRCVTLEGLANSLAQVLRSLNNSIRNVEQEANTSNGLQNEDASPWSGVNSRQPTLLGIYGGLKEIFKIISWLNDILMKCFQGLSDRHWHEVKRAEQAKCVLDALYYIMEDNYVEGNANTQGSISRADVVLHLFVGALNPYLDLLNRLIFERGHFDTIPLDGELFFATPASISVGASPMRERNQSFREGLLALAPFEVNQSLVPIFLESMIELMNEAVASRQMKNRFLQHQQYTSEESPERTRAALHELVIKELDAMGCIRNTGIFSVDIVSRENEEDFLSSQQIMLDCIPFNRILERCLTSHLESKCRELNSDITNIFRGKMNYMEHVKALRMFVLMEQQDVFNVFSEKLVAHMQENPVAWADSEMINAFLQSAVQGIFEDNSLSSSQRQIGGRLCVRVDFNLLDSRTSSGARIDISTLKCLHFTFSAQQPLRVLFSASIMQKYSRLGVFLVQVKAVESALVKVRSINVFHPSFTNLFISSSVWSKHQKILQLSRSLEEMDTIHQQYLDHLLSRFFLLDKHATVIQYILTTFNHILRYVGQLDEFVSVVGRNLTKYSSDNWNNDDADHSTKKDNLSVRLLEHSDFRIIKSEMERSSKEFKRQSHFLVVMLTAMEKHGASPHVNEIVTQLNYNYFYHQQQHRFRTQPREQQKSPVKQSKQDPPPFNRSGSLRPPPAPIKYLRTRSTQMS